ncbi:hypothetical protein B7463_g10289, partial [Scytalidium lignicola]
MKINENEFIGERSTNNNTIITFGRLKNNYAEFSGDIYGLETMNVVEVGGEPQTKSHQENDQDSTGDGNSQKGILQIRTAVISYAQRQDKQME